MVMLSTIAGKNVLIQNERTYRFWNITYVAAGPFIQILLLQLPALQSMWGESSVERQSARQMDTFLGTGQELTFIRETFSVNVQVL